MQGTPKTPFLKGSPVEQDNCVGEHSSYNATETKRLWVGPGD